MRDDCTALGWTTSVVVLTSTPQAVSMALNKAILDKLRTERPGNLRMIVSIHI